MCLPFECAIHGAHSSQKTELPPATLKVLRLVVLVGVVLICTLVLDVMLIVQSLSIFLCVALRPLAVKPVLALCFGELVNLGASKAGEELLGELMGNRLAYGI